MTIPDAIATPLLDAPAAGRLRRPGSAAAGAADPVASSHARRFPSVVDGEDHASRDARRLVVRAVGDRRGPPQRAVVAASETIGPPASWRR